LKVDSVLWKHLTWIAKVINSTVSFIWLQVINTMFIIFLQRINLDVCDFVVQWSAEASRLWPC